MKKLFFTASMLLSIAAYSQVGINTQTPKGTLDVAAKKTDGTTAEGLIAPRLTGDQIKAADAQYGTDQKGIIVYATAAVGTSSTKTANITSEGYYYFDGNLWQKVSSATAASGWRLTGNSGTTASTSAIGTDVNNNFIGTTDAKDLVLASNNKEVMRINGNNQQIGISTTTPQATLDVVGIPTDVSKLDGIIPPRITGDQLRAKTYTASQTGAMVYATAADTTPSGQTINVIKPGFYYFDGTVWNLLQAQNQSVGSTVYKDLNQTLTSFAQSTKVFNVGDFEFKLAADGNSGYFLQIRFTGSGTRAYSTIATTFWMPGSPPGYNTVGNQNGVATGTFTNIAGGTYGQTPYMVGIVRIFDKVTGKYYNYEISRIMNGVQSYISQKCEVL